MNNGIITLMQSGATGFTPVEIEYGTLIFAHGTTVAKYGEDDIQISYDEGETYPQSCTFPAGLGRADMRYFYVFENGNCMFCTHTTAYYTTDFTNWQESVCLETNGAPWVRELMYDNFTPNQYGRSFNINGVNKHLWSSYNNTENENGMSTSGISYIWMTEDGSELRIIFSLAGGAQPTICANTGLPVIMRHIHSVQQDPYTNKLYLDGGDEPRNINAHWVTGTYDVNGLFTWNDLGTNTLRKTVGIFFDETYIYGILDTENGGLIRYVKGQEGDPANAVQLLTTPNDCGGAAFGKNGDVCIIYLRWNNDDVGHVLFYSRDKINWHRIVVELEDLPEGSTINTVFSRIWQPLESGKVLAAVQVQSRATWDTFDMLPSVWINKVLDKYGYPNAFK